MIRPSLPSQPSWYQQCVSWSHEVVLFALLIGLLLFANYYVPGFLTFRSQNIPSRKLWDFALVAIIMTPAKRIVSKVRGMVSASSKGW